jgi:hypothetical protein
MAGCLTAVLNNDQKSMTDQLDRLLQELHGQAKPRQPAASSSGMASSTLGPSGHPITAASNVEPAENPEHRPDERMTPFAVGENKLLPGPKS